MDANELVLFAPPAAPHLLPGLAELSLQDGQTGLQLLGAVAELGIGPVHGGLAESVRAHLLLQLLLSLLQQLPAVGNAKTLLRSVEDDSVCVCARTCVCWGI